jgi:hypothetical protein
MKKTQNGTAVRIRVLAIVLILVFAGAFIFFTLDRDLFRPRDVSIGELYDRPSGYIGRKVNAVGYLVKYTAPHLGDDYRLYEGDPRNLYFAVNPSIAVSGESSIVDRYISFTSASHEPMRRRSCTSGPERRESYPISLPIQ